LRSTNDCKFGAKQGATSHANTICGLGERIPSIVTNKSDFLDSRIPNCQEEKVQPLGMDDSDVLSVRRMDIRDRVLREYSSVNTGSSSEDRVGD
jgi:hypothetical protein